MLPRTDRIKLSTEELAHRFDCWQSKKYNLFKSTRDKNLDIVSFHLSDLTVSDIR